MKSTPQKDVAKPDGGAAAGEMQVLDIPNDTTRLRLTAVVGRVAQQHEIAHAIAPTDSLVDHGMTSMAMIDLMLAIEAEFDIMLPQREMTAANFQSILSLTLMVKRVV